MTMFDYSEQPREQLLEYMRVQASAPTNEPLITRAVNIMNDWTGGQVDQFYRAIDKPNAAECDYYEMYALLAEIALNAARDRLTTYAVSVATILYENFPAMKSGVATHDATSIKKRKRKPSSSSSVARRVPGFIYLIQSPMGAYKIGRTINPDDRLRTFSVKLPFEVEYVCVIRTNDMFNLETSLHNRFEDKRLNGEWFNLSPEDIEYIKGLAT